MRIPETPKFSSPSVFWFLNGKLEAAEIRRQLTMMREKGFDEVIPHARYGLETAFLSEDWFNVYDVIVEEAALHGMRIWIYDELNWPSGTGGGKVTAEEKLCEHYLDSENRLCPNTFWKEGSPDYLNPDAAIRFLDICYKPYFERYGRYFGNVIAGFFNDEVRFANATPWSKALPFPPPSGLEYWESVQGAIQGYFNLISEWCHKHGVLLIGHVMGEETLGSAVRYVGGKVLRLLEHFDWKGIDHLGKNAEGMHPRIAASAGYFEETREIFCETGAGLPWDFTATDLYRVFGWLYANGITRQTMHGFFYREYPEDWPPDMFFRAKSWEKTGEFVRWAGRVQHFLSLLRPVNRVFVYYPVKEFLQDYIPDRAFNLNFKEGAYVQGSQARALHLALQELHAALRSKQIDYLLVSEENLPKLQEGVLLCPSDTDPDSGIPKIRQGAGTAENLVERLLQVLPERTFVDGIDTVPRSPKASPFINDPYVHESGDEGGVHLKEFRMGQQDVLLVWNANPNDIEGIVHTAKMGEWTCYNPREETLRKVELDGKNPLLIRSYNLLFFIR